MLAIVTGLPGAAKTLYTLSTLINLFKDRQVYIYNIPDIDHEFFGSQPLTDPDNWYELPDGAVIIMDEAQEVFPLRMAGSQVPQKCAAFERHRHQGHDIFLITQDATLLDVHIRKLAGKHYHLKRLFGTESSTVFEYDKFQPKPEDQNTIKRAVAKPTWFFDKSIYSHYKSAELHTVKRKIPFKLLILPLFFVLAIGVGWWSITTLMALVSNDKEDFEAGISTIGGAAAVGEKTPGVILNPVEHWVAQRTPVIEGMPWTAPMFKEVQDIKAFPKPHCIIYGADGFDLGTCQCYSQQVTKIRNVNDHVCRQLASEGWFDYTLESRSRGGGQAPPVRAPAPTPQRKVSNVVNGSTYQGKVFVGSDPRPGRAIRTSKRESTPL